MIFYNIANAMLSMIAGRSKSVTTTGLCYLGLCTAAPSPDGNTLNEISKTDYPSYERILLCAYDASALTSVWNSPSGGVIVNEKPFSGDSQCAETNGWPECSHWALFDAKTGGNPMVADVFRDPDGSPDSNGLYPQTTLKVGHKQVPVFRKGALQLTLK